LSQKQQANVCTSSTPTEYGSASPGSAPADDVSTACNDVTGECDDAGEVADVEMSAAAGWLPVTEQQSKNTAYTIDVEGQRDSQKELHNNVNSCTN